jgi:DNA-binding HxlR family transcriptional regulator
LPSSRTSIRIQCPVELTLSVIGGKWKPLILWELRGRPRRFSELEASLTGITHKVLSDQLRALERDGVLTRTVRDERVRVVEYALSEFGLTLRPVMNVMAQWAKVHYRRLGEAHVKAR